MHTTLSAKFIQCKICHRIMINWIIGHMQHTHPELNNTRWDTDRGHDPDVEKYFTILCYTELPDPITRWR